jgi:3-hydroxyisobutyrate dehydrogenase-like beta-hydroxyacid dehydrogenase
MEKLQMTSVGFIGLGNMGLPMATRLRDAKIELVVHDARGEQASAFAGDAHRVGATPREVADSADIVFLSLPTPAIVRAVVEGEDGLERGRRAKLVVDLSTTGPATAVAVAKSLAARRISFIDAPVSGGVSGAQKGTLAIMASGAREDFERARPFLERIGRVFLVGDRPGQGQAMKLLNNQLSATAMAATAEVMALGVKAGLDAATMLEVLNASSGRNTATTDKFPRSVLDRSFDFGFRAVLLHKDVRLCKEFAAQYGVPFAIGDMVEQVWDRAASELGDGDFTRIVELVEREAHVTIRGNTAAKG